MCRIATILFSFLLIVGVAPIYQVQLSTRGTIIEGVEIVYMEPSEVVFDWGTLKPGGRRDIYHQLCAKLTAGQKTALTAELDLSTAVHFKTFMIWIQIVNIETGSNIDWFPSLDNPSETQTVPAGVYDVYYDCTAFARDDITKTVSGEVLTRLRYDTNMVGTFRIRYTVSS